MAGDFKPQEVANLMWALVAFERSCLDEWADAVSCFVPTLAHVAGDRPVGDGSTSAAFLSQLHQALVCIRLEGLWPELDLAGTLGADVVMRCRRAFESGSARPSNLQVGEAGPQG